MAAGEGHKEIEVEEEVKPKQYISHPAVVFPHLVATSHSQLTKQGTGRRKKISMSAKQRKVAKERFGFLNKNFYPVPFSPVKTLDFSAHQQLFHFLGLWDFAHVQLDEEIRPDLLADLIAYYDSSNRRSYVQNNRISVTRSHLALALGLPLKKEKADLFQGKDSLQELVSVDGAATTLLDFMSNYMIFGDMCILPSVIIQAIEFVKDGVPYKVDWAAIMWVLVEKELSEGHKSGTFCYASHLQRLIKHQRPQIFSKEPEPVFPIPDPEEDEVSVANEAVVATEDEVNGAEEVHLTEEESEAGIGFGLMLDDNVMGDFDDGKANFEREWLEGGKNEGFEQCLRLCNSKSSDNMDFENLAKIDEVENLERFANGDSVKFSTFERLNSTDLLQEMNNVNIPYASQVNSLNPSSGALSTYLNFNGKRQVDEIGDEEREQIDYKTQQKRMRPCEPCENLPFSFDDCLSQVQGGAKRAKALYAEKEQEVTKMEEEMQYLNHLIHDKERKIQSLTMMVEGQPNWQIAVRHYEHEICFVSQMMLGYKRALKETRGKFAVYRKKHPRDDESLYKDVPGTGGLVLSAKEFEKDWLVKEEEKRQYLLGAFGYLQQILNKFEICEERIRMHDSKLGKLVEGVEQLKERFAKSSCFDA